MKRRKNKKPSDAWKLMKSMEKQYATTKEIGTAVRKLKKKKKREQEHEKKKQERIAELKALPYKQYLLSDWWKFKRKQKLKSVRYRCNRCGGKAWQVHHLHYKSLGQEKKSDLEALCGGCHSSEHECLVQCNSHLSAIAGSPESNLALSALIAKLP